MRKAKPDLEISTNCDVTAVRPSPNGRLRMLIREAKDGTNRVWIFCNPETWSVGKDEYVDRLQRGLASGTSIQGEEFIALCRSLDLVVQESNFFVPLSNGRTECLGEARSSIAGGAVIGSRPSLWDYPGEEQLMVRWDLPKREVLEKALAQ